MKYSLIIELVNNRAITGTKKITYYCMMPHGTYLYLKIYKINWAIKKAAYYF